MNGGTDTASLFAVAARVRRALARGVLPLAVYEIFAKVFIAGVLGPVSAGLFALWIWRTGSAAVSNEGILTFVLSPTGCAAVISSGALAVFIAFFETAGLLTIADRSLDGRPCRAVVSIRRALARAPGLLALSVLQIAAFAAAALPFAFAAAILYRLLLAEHDINFYLATKPAEFWWAASLGGVCLLGLASTWAVFHLRLLFALPACVVSSLSARRALQSSWQLTGHRLRRLALAMAAWLALTTGLSLAAWLLIEWIKSVMMAAAGDRVGMLVFVLACLLALHGVAAAIVSFVGTTTYALLVAALYRDASGGPEAPEERLEAASGPSLPAWLSKPRAFWGLAAVFVLAAGTITWLILASVPVETVAAVTAHRGSSRAAPENTVSAVETAIRQGADFAEIDVQETADGQVVVIHDTDLMRIARSPKKISQATYEEIARCDAGSWFSPQFAGERVPTLQQVVDAARGRIRLNIEMKFDGNARSLAARVVDILRKNDFRSQCVITSLDYGGLREVKRLDSGLKVGHIVSLAIGDVTRLDADFLSLHHKRAAPGLVDSLHRAGKDVHVWTVNDRPTLLRVIDSGVDNIITDDPELVLSVLSEWQELDKIERLILASRSWFGK